MYFYILYITFNVLFYPFNLNLSVAVTYRQAVRNYLLCLPIGCSGNCAVSRFELYYGNVYGMKQDCFLSEKKDEL